MSPTRCVILVGHGAVPTDCPAELVSEFKKEEARSKGRPSPRLLELDAQLRQWPRSPKNDAYKTGLEEIAARLARKMPDHRVVTAYNEFCAPSLEAAFDQAVSSGARLITVVSTMYTRGGVHSETEIPQIVEDLKRRHPGIEIRYVWPYDLDAVTGMLAGEVRRAESAARA